MQAEERPTGHREAHRPKRGTPAEKRHTGREEAHRPKKSGTQAEEERHTARPNIDTQRAERRHACRRRGTQAEEERHTGRRRAAHRPKNRHKGRRAAHRPEKGTRQAEERECCLVAEERQRSCISTAWGPPRSPPKGPSLRRRETPVNSSMSPYDAGAVAPRLTHNASSVVEGIALEYLNGA